jgi:hypothetical protein
MMLDVAQPKRQDALLLPLMSDYPTDPIVVEKGEGRNQAGLAIRRTRPPTRAASKLRLVAEITELAKAVTVSRVVFWAMRDAGVIALLESADSEAVEQVHACRVSVRHWKAPLSQPQPTVEQDLNDVVNEFVTKGTCMA